MDKLRVASLEEFEKLKNFYYSVIDGLEGTPYLPAWQKGVYPYDSQLQDALSKGELFVFEEDGNLIGAAIFNSKVNEEYNKINWPTEARGDEVMTIHILAIGPRAQRHGYGRRMVTLATDYAREQGFKVIRIDAWSANAPAIKLYTQMGFKEVAKASFCYKDDLRGDFSLFEYAL